MWRGYVRWPNNEDAVAEEKRQPTADRWKLRVHGGQQADCDRGCGKRSACDGGRDPS